MSDSLDEGSQIPTALQIASTASLAACRVSQFFDRRYGRMRLSKFTISFHSPSTPRHSGWEVERLVVPAGVTNEGEEC